MADWNDQQGSRQRGETIRSHYRGSGKSSVRSTGKSLHFLGMEGKLFSLNVRRKNVSSRIMLGS